MLSRSLTIWQGRAYSRFCRQCRRGGSAVMEIDEAGGLSVACSSSALSNRKPEAPAGDGLVETDLEVKEAITIGSDPEA